MLPSGHTPMWDAEAAPPEHTTAAIHRGRSRRSARNSIGSTRHSRGDSKRSVAGESMDLSTRVSPVRRARAPPASPSMACRPAAGALRLPHQAQQRLLLARPERARRAAREGPEPERAHAHAQQPAHRVPEREERAADLALPALAQHELEAARPARRVVAQPPDATG